MEREDLETYLREQIPLSAAMGVSVCSITEASVTLSAPLAPNINHKSTVFGGSASALSILAAWSTLHVRLLDAGLPSEIVIQSNTMEYERPVRGEFVATGAIGAASEWPAFLKMLERRKRARIEIEAELRCGDEAVGAFSGRFVAFLREGR
ncbi:thioesterase domain-containing protein [Pleomorphomonas oryzae]|uniref:thioesterase domain-containing protein n=1 Tax=Pleomorphomonas oryzae TaxID=261934 RepID=UPI00041A85DF|nr:thioesterase domain-containing protein [Pleomorphomonas oryzae]